MDATDKHVIRIALETLRAAGGAGVRKKALLSQMQLAAGTPVSEETLEDAFGVLRDRGWIESHLEPIWHEQRWTVTEHGLTVLEGL